MRFPVLLFLCFSLSSVAQTPCESGLSDIYPCQNIELWAFLPLSELGSPTGMNDVWGWTEHGSGREFAIACHRSGTAFVEVTDPANPVFLGTLPSAVQGNNTWRDAKVFQDHVFIVSEAGNHGMQVMDLNDLVDPDLVAPATFTTVAHYDLFSSCHNIAINEETGFAYAVGTNTADGGLHVIDISDPANPAIAGTFEADGYTHDVQVVIYNGPDDDYQGKEIAFASNEDTVTIIDVTDKSDMTMIASIGYELSAYCHQGWLTEDQRYFLSNDELDEMNFGVNTTTHMWDFADLDNPIHLGPHVADITATDHNLYVKGDLVFQSNYRDGLRVLDASDIGNAVLEEVAYFDVLPTVNQAGFTGTWSNYPYFESGTIVVTDITQGLFVLQLNFTVFQGCTDPLACNFDPEANVSDFSCVFADQGYDCAGVCLDDADGDGVCDPFEVPGCTDAEACNYNDAATDDDASCTYAADFYDCDGECLNDDDADGVCNELEVAGCTDENACNYLPEATDEDASCIYAADFYDCEGNCLNDDDADGVCNELEVAGCQDEAACNYDPEATDSGDCEYPVAGTLSGIPFNADEGWYASLGGTENLTYTPADPASDVLVEIISGAGTVTTDDGMGSFSVDISDSVTLIQITETPPNGCVSVTTYEIHIVSSIGETNAWQFQLFPNPTSDLVHLQTAAPGLVTVQVRDGLGQLVVSETFATHATLDLSALPAGRYIVEMKHGATVRSKPLVIQR